MTAEERRAYHRDYYAKNREKILAQQLAGRKAFREANPIVKKDPIPGRVKTANYRERHKATKGDEWKRKAKEYRYKNGWKVRMWRRKHHHKMMQEPVNVLVKRMRSRLGDELRFRARRTKKFSGAMELVGCIREQLAAHIESLFKPGMSWANRSAWHIDHIRPVSSFDMMNFEEQKKCFHFTNLQPLWKSENCAKGDKYEPTA